MVNLELHNPFEKMLNSETEVLKNLVKHFK